MGKDRKDYFAKIKELSTDAMRLRWFAKQGDGLKGGKNNSFDSLEVGKITNSCASFRTSTITEYGKSKDVVVMNVYDANSDEEIEVLFDKDDCLEFMSYLATAAYSLRN